MRCARASGPPPQDKTAEITDQGIVNADVDRQDGATGDDLTLLLEVIARIKTLDD